MTFSAVILAGGQSRRMGRDKAWLKLDGQSLIARQVELARTLGAAEVFISGRAGTDYDSLGCRVLRDRVADAGPLAGVESALTAMTTPLLLALAVDMPGMTASHLRALLAHCSELRGAIPRFPDHLEPLAAIYPGSCLEIAKELLDSRRYAVGVLAQRCVELKLATFVDFSQQQMNAFANWNTPADVQAEVNSLG